MYLDYILLALGGVMLLAALVLAVLLFRSRKKSLEYRRVLHEETERIDVVETMRRTHGDRSSFSTGPRSRTAEATELLSDPPRAVPPDTPGAKKESNTFPIFRGMEEPSVLSGEHGGQDGGDLDLSPLEGKYELRYEIHGGGMSRIFLARHVKLGSDWIVKFVDGRHAELANEADVLKKLNHISLPQIIDIFPSEQGTFLVERYIEGCNLEQVLQEEEMMKKGIKEGLIYRWGIELAQVLNYLHSLDAAIIHCDLKPSNVMVTYDNHLALIDFGISKRQGIDAQAQGLTYRYAAPEQFQGRLSKSDMARQRFGELPEEHESWKIDARTDIYSTGVILFELAAGELPTAANQSILFEKASAGLAAVIAKCLEVDPARRYQSARELANALEALSGKQVSMARSLVMRRVASVCCGVLLAAGLGSTASGFYINQNETQAVVVMLPGEAVVTEQQGIELLLQKWTPNGKTVELQPSQVEWTYSDGSVARLEGNRLVGMNVGETTLLGRYRNKEVSLHVTVTEPPAEMTPVSLRYPEGGAPSVSVYAGSGERDFVDGALAECSFVSPERLWAEGGRLCVSDSGTVRILEDGQVSSLALEPSYLTADQVLSRDGALYVRTGPWESDEGSYYGIIRIADGGAEFLFYTDAAWSVIHDMAFSSDGTLWFLWENMGTGETGLYFLDPATQEATWVMSLPDGAGAMAFDSADNLYIAVPEAGLIVRIGRGEESWSYFAGVEGERGFIDGPAPRFYRPSALVADGDSPYSQAGGGDALYVLDFDTVRRITIDDSGTIFAETLAGIPVADTNPAVVLGTGAESVFPASELASLAVDGEGRLLLTDPKNSVIYQIDHWSISG